MKNLKNEGWDVDCHSCQNGLKRRGL